MGFSLLFAIFVGGSIGVLVGVLFLYLVSEEGRWRNFLGTIEHVLDNRLTRPLFDSSLGRWANRKTIESYVRSRNFDRAGDLAVREGFVDETIHFLEIHGHTREAAVLARRLGRDDKADDLYRRLIDGFLADGKATFAAEAAEEAGFWDESVQLFAGLGSRESRLHAARLAAGHGQPAFAVQAFLENEALADALRVAEENGQVDFVFRHCEASGNPVLHHFAADTAKRIGEPERGVDILEKHVGLHQAALFAREAGLDERAEEILERLRAEKRRPGLDSLDGI